MTSSTTEVETDSDTGEGSDRFQMINALLLALVTLLGAFVAWRASVAADGAGDAALEGLIANINAEETRVVNDVTLYEHYRAYTVYTRYNALGNQIEADLEEMVDADEDEVAALDRQMREAWDSAESLSFPRRYLRRDGTYDVQRELGEAWAEAARQKDIEPEPHFVEADRLQEKSNILIVIVTVLGGALLAHTLAETLSNDKLKYVLMILGIVLTLASVAALVAVELVVFA